MNGNFQIPDTQDYARNMTKSTGLLDYLTVPADVLAGKFPVKNISGFPGNPLQSDYYWLNDIHVVFCKTCRNALVHSLF